MKTNKMMLGVLPIAETSDVILAKYPHLKPVVEKYKHEGRKREKLSVYSLLYNMVDDSSLIIGHDEVGKPLLDDYAISVSDTRGFVAVLLSKDRKDRVGVDIEYMSDRVLRIVDKFVRPDEHAADVYTALVHWSAKEAVYKYFSEQDLLYFDMRLHAFEIDNANQLTGKPLSAENPNPMTTADSLSTGEPVPLSVEGVVLVDNLKTGETVEVNYLINRDYVLTWL